ncbi:MAG: enoyl-CoA hydratase [Polaromonas sp.]|jgi:enoyl-CoA hydratase|nr:enoyl-CoA hydratase [Polaromonas sp.]
MQFETLLCETQPNGCLVVTINRPEVRNAINTKMGEELRDLFKPLRFTPGDLRCIILTGAGDKAFSSGGDLKERKTMTEAAWRLQHAIFEEAFYAVMDCSVPVIAAVNGVAYAGGCELALASDFIYAASTAKFALSEASLGIIPGAGGTQNLPRAVGERRAKELIMTANPFTAEQAYTWGMLNAVCPPEELMSSVLATAARICQNAPISISQAKKAIHFGMQTDLKTGLMMEVQAYEKVITSEDRKEGILAFNEKRPPLFQGR